jgi:hypothetical protein
VTCESNGIFYFKDWNFFDNQVWCLESLKKHCDIQIIIIIFKRWRGEGRGISVVKPRSETAALCTRVEIQNSRYCRWNERQEAPPSHQPLRPTKRITWYRYLVPCVDRWSVAPRHRVSADGSGSLLEVLVPTLGKHIVASHRLHVRSWRRMAYYNMLSRKWDCFWKLRFRSVVFRFEAGHFYLLWNMKR